MTTQVPNAASAAHATQNGGAGGGPTLKTELLQENSEGEEEEDELFDYIYGSESNDSYVVGE